MRRLLQILGTALLSAGVVSGVAAAQSNINNTGPGSDNMITHNNSTETDIDCTNDVNVNNDNSQSANSGSANSSGNTTGGGAQSGSANNSNSTSTNVDASCLGAAAAAQQPAPRAAGGGDVVGEAVTADQPKVAALPVTGDNSAITYVAGAAVSAGLLAGLSRLVVRSYRHFALRQL